MKRIKGNKKMTDSFFLLFLQKFRSFTYLTKLNPYIQEVL